MSFFLFLDGSPRVNNYGDSLIPNEIHLPVTQYDDDKAFGEIITAASYLPRIQLFGGNSDAAKQNKIGLGRYGLVLNKDQIEDLTAQFDCLPLSFRFKAMRIDGDNVLSYHNPHSEEFKTIQAESEVKDSGCMYGVEFLLWLPSHKKYVTFFFSSKTARRESPNLRQLLIDRKAATFKVNYIKKGKHSWHGPVITPCSTPFELPDMAEMFEQAEKFANPKDSVVEKAEESGNGRER